MDNTIWLDDTNHSCYDLCSNCKCKFLFWWQWRYLLILNFYISLHCIGFIFMFPCLNTYSTLLISRPSRICWFVWCVYPDWSCFLRPICLRRSNPTKCVRTSKSCYWMDTIVCRKRRWYLSSGFLNGKKYFHI